MAKRTKGITPSKAVERQWKIYLETLEDTGVELPEMEALRPYMGKRGRVLKRAVRSKAAQEAYKEAEQGVKQKFGNRAGATAIQKAMKQQDNKNRAQKAVETHRRKNLQAATRGRRDQEGEAPDEQGAPEEKPEKPEETPEDKVTLKEAPKEEPAPQKEESLVDKAKRALKEAEEAAARAQLELEQAKRDLSFAQLIEEFQKGSREKLSNKVIYEVYRNLEAQGVAPEDIDAYIDKLKETVNDIPDEALALWEEDEFAMVLTAMNEFNEQEKEDFSTALNAVIMSDKEDVVDIMEAIRYWEDPENNTGGMSFSQFWESAQGYNNPLERSTWEEILGGDDDE